MEAIKDIIDIDYVHASYPFSVCLMNPPYNKANTFLAHILPMSQTCVSIQPTAWLFGKNKDMKIVNQIKDCHCDLEIVNPSIFDAGFLGRVAITHIDKNKDKHINITNDITHKNIQYDDIMDVSELSMDDKLTEFNNKVKPLYEEDNMQDHIRRNYGKYHNDNIDLINKQLPIVRISAMRGSVDQNTGHRHHDFFTLISNNENELKNKTLSNTRNFNDTNKPGGRFIITWFILCKNEREQHNIINYMKTDFCRTCLMMIKNNVHLDRGELKYIPWFDFNDEHFSKTPREIDDYLFSKYNIPDDIRKYIESILPDYYNIR